MVPNSIQGGEVNKCLKSGLHMRRGERGWGLLWGHDKGDSEVVRFARLYSATTCHHICNNYR